ncbi:MAG: hypothetical protein ACI81L_000732 [Verrucomicrobiales bacterium]|jgi:hypothetical protein
MTYDRASHARATGDVGLFRANTTVSVEAETAALRTVAEFSGRTFPRHRRTIAALAASDVITRLTAGQ